MTRASFRIVTLLAIALATAAALPTLGAPWDEDEVFLVGAATGTSPWMNTRFDAYRFSSGEAPEVAARIATGVFPWYTAPDFKYALFRPLTSAVLWLDSLAFGEHRAGYQVHAMLWHALLVVAAALVLARALPGAMGKGALFLFATSVTHTTATGWLTARHVLVASVPAMFGLACHLRGTRASRLLAVSLFGVGLLASEAAMQVLAYVVAFELCDGARGGRPLGRRLLALAPYAALVVVYVVAYRWLGRGHDYGAPFADLSAFLGRGLPKLALHAGILLGVSLRPDNGWGFYALRGTILVAPVVLVAFVLATRRARLEESERAGVVWLAVGSFLALLPVIGAPLESRVLLPSSLGAAVMVASVLAVALRERGVFGVAGAVVAVVHVGLVAVELPQHYLAMSRQREQRLGTFARARMADEGRTSLVIGAPHFLFGQLGGFLRERTTGARRVPWVPLADANCAHEVRRPEARRLEITPRCRPGFFPYGRLEQGDEVRQQAWTVRVTAPHPEGRFEVVFERPIEELPLDLVTFDGFVDRVVPPPAVGASVVLPEPAPAALYGLDGPTAWMQAWLGT